VLEQKKQEQVELSVLFEVPVKAEAPTPSEQPA